MTETPTLQGGMSNAELTDAWCKKLPGVIPTDRDLSAFAVGIEVGFARAQDLERTEWIRVHHALAKHGKHPGRTDDHAADVIDRALEAQAAQIEALRAEVAALKRKPLTDAEIEAGRDAIFSTNNLFCLCDSKTMRKVVRWAERAHKIDAAMAAKGPK